MVLRCSYKLNVSIWGYWQYGRCFCQALSCSAKAGKMHEKGWVAKIGSSQFCVYKGTANGVCHLGATSLSSTLPAYSCATNWQAQSLLFHAQSIPWVCIAPDLHPAFQTHAQTLEILPPLLTTLPVQADFLHLWYVISASPDQGVIHLTSMISLNTLEMLMLSWCEQKGFLNLQSLKESAGEGKSEETSFLCSAPGGGWNGEPIATIHFATVRGPATACTEGEGKKTFSQSPSRLDQLSPQCTNLNYTLYVMADEKRWLICR